MKIVINKLTTLDKVFLLIMGLDLAIILCPWQFVPMDNSEKTIYRILLHSVLTGVFTYLLFRINVESKKVRWTLKIICGVFLAAGLLNIGAHIMFWGLPAEFNHYLCYESVNNKREKVLNIFYKNFLPTQDRWRYKRVIEFYEYHFRLERAFDQSDLEGNWKVYDIDNGFKYEKTVRFEKGKVIEVIETTDTNHR